MAVSISGRRSARGEIGTQPARRWAAARGTSAISIRATRWPPAEWPARRTGPATSAAARSMARATSAVIAAMRARGASV